MVVPRTGEHRSTGHRLIDVPGKTKVAHAMRVAGASYAAGFGMRSSKSCRPCVWLLCASALTSSCWLRTQAWLLACQLMAKSIKARARAGIATRSQREQFARDHAIGLREADAGALIGAVSYPVAYLFVWLQIGQRAEMLAPIQN